MMIELQIRDLEARRCAVARHQGGFATLDETRRPMYQHMIMHELVGGASMLRFAEDHSDGEMDVLIGATCGFDGDNVVTVEEVPAGRYATWHFEGRESALPTARQDFLDAVADLHPVGRLYQVHLMDAIDGETEQEFQIRLE